MSRRTASVPLAVLLALVLAACGPTPSPGASPVGPAPSDDPGPTPTSSPSGEPSSPAADPLDTVTWIFLRTEQAYFCDDVACGVDGFRFDDPADEAITKLTAVFGREPVAESYAGVSGSTSHSYAWGDDFLLYFSTGGTGVPPTLHLQVTAAAVDGVRVETLHGVRVGLSMSEAWPLAEYTRVGGGDPDDVLEAHFDLVDVAANTWNAVVAFASPTLSSPISTIVVPATTGALPGS